jgi:hypothetical protein
MVKSAANLTKKFVLAVCLITGAADATTPSLRANKSEFIAHLLTGDGGVSGPYCIFKYSSSDKDYWKYQNYPQFTKQVESYISAPRNDIVYSWLMPDGTFALIGQQRCVSMALIFRGATAELQSVIGGGVKFFGTAVTPAQLRDSLGGRQAPGNSAPVHLLPLRH